MAAAAARGRTKETGGRREDGTFAGALAGELDQPRKGERTRAAVLLAGNRLLETLAPQDLTVAQIAAEAGIAHGTFYLHFKDRQDFLSALLMRFAAFLEETMRRAAHDAGSEAVSATTAAYVEAFEANRGLMRALVTQADSLPECRAAFHALNRDWAARVAQAALRRTPDASREELLRRAHALGGMVDQYLIQWLLNGDPNIAALSGDRAAVIATLTHLWTKGMDA